MPTTIEILEEAKHLLNTCGWRQYEYGNCDIGFCLFGAVDQVTGRQDITDLITDLTEAERVLEQTVNKYFDSTVITFNDTEGRTKQDIITLIDLAIQELA